MIDWARQVFTGSNIADESKDSFFIGAQAPFSFTYAERPSNDLLPAWTKTTDTQETAEGPRFTTVWTDPETGLKVTSVALAYDRYSAVDWVLYFENTGSQDTPILEDIQAADFHLNTQSGLAMLHRLNGDEVGLVGEDSFAPVDVPIYQGRTVRLAPSGGRPSSGVGFPFFNYECQAQGIIAAIGWTGQWAATIEHFKNGPSHVRAGMELTHLLLHPGEKIRSPRILLMRWEGDRIQAHNQFRRLMLDHYSPQADGRPIELPVAMQTFDRYRFSPGWATESGQLAAVETAHQLGCDTYWLDAAWYQGGFPNGAGNWFADADAFPNGLKPVADACHERGMKFVLWFDPERVAKGTQIDMEHTDWVLRKPNAWGLFDLGNPAARRWLTELLSKRIEEWDIDIYRNDFNVAPLDYWRQKDTSDRQGMSEIRHVEGLYEMWDELLAQHPGLVIDNCASGGRRIDIEMGKRSVTLWRSDSGCWDCPQEWNQTQTLGISMYVPLHASGVQSPDSYTFRSVATAGAICEFGYMDAGFSMESAKAAISEAKENRKYWHGDIYPLTNCNVATDHLMAFQLHRADLDEGMILAFRRADCPTTGLIAQLRGIRGDRDYNVEFIGDERESKFEVISGVELAENGLTLRLNERQSSLLVRYKPV